MIYFTLILGLIIWFMYYGFECFLNGGTIWRGLIQDIGWFFPIIGPKNKIKYIKQIIGEDGDGYIGSFSYRDIREHNLYLECANEVLPGRYHFILTHIILPLFPLIVYFSIKNTLQLQ